MNKNIKKQAVLNIYREWKKSYSIEYNFTSYLKLLIHTFPKGFITAFLWTNSKEGLNYWQKIYKKLK